MIAVEMAVDHPFDRLVGHFANAIEQIAGIARMRARVDQKHALVGDDKHRVGPIEIEKEIEVARDLFDRGRRTSCAAAGKTANMMPASKASARTKPLPKTARTLNRALEIVLVQNVFIADFLLHRLA